MKKIFMLCLSGAIALTAASCGDDDDGGAKPGKMSVDSQIEEAKSAIYIVKPATQIKETEITIYLFKDVVTEMPLEGPDFQIITSIGESHLGKTLDLTKPLTGSPGFYVGGMNGVGSFDVTSSEGSIKTTDSVTPEEAATVTAGTAFVSRNGSEFTIKISVTLSSGRSLSADWKGKATQLEY